MTYSRKKELIYIALQFFQGINALTWVQILYNEPSAVESKGVTEWAIVIAISLSFVIAQTLTTWKAYLSDPHSQGDDEPIVTVTSNTASAQPNVTPPAG